MGISKSDSSSRLYHGSPYLSKLESISSSAVRAADKVGASLIVVYTHTGEAGCAGRASTSTESLHDMCFDTAWNHITGGIM